MKIEKPAQELVDVALRHYEGAGQCGVGHDAYEQSIRHDHPMAVGLYLRGLVYLYRATRDASLLGEAERLAQHLADLSGGGPRLSWGLPFAWNDKPAGHSYAVTTAICGTALLELLRAGGGKEASHMLDSCCRWLTEDLPWDEGPDEVGPWYSTLMPEVITNSTALVGGLLLAAAAHTGVREHRERGTAALVAVTGAQHERGFWTYRSQAARSWDGTASDRVVDSLHSAYVLEGLSAAIGPGAPAPSGLPGLQAAVSLGLDLLGSKLMTLDGGVYEKLRLVRTHDADQRMLLSREDLDRWYLPPAGWLVRFPGEARLWGKGAALGALARGYERGEPCLEQACALAVRLETSSLSHADGHFGYLPEDLRRFPRHEAHAFEGIAALAAVIGGQCGLA